MLIVDSVCLKVIDAHNLLVGKLIRHFPVGMDLYSWEKHIW